MYKSAIRASIDIGTNTVLLLVAKQSTGLFKPIFELQETPRLGKGVDESKTLADDSIQRVLKVLKSNSEILKRDFHFDKKPIITATSAVRDASNRKEFIQLVKQETDWDIQLLSGMEEAAWTYAGALSVQNVDENGKYVVIDIGGGSTELAWGSGYQLISRFSFDMGSVRFTERFLKGNPPEKEIIDQAYKTILETFKSYPEKIQTDSVKAIGVAGTVTSIVYIKKKLNEYDSDSINSEILSLDDLNDVFDEFSNTKTEIILQKYPEVMKGRADVFLAGIMILKGFMEVFGFKTITVSTGGIRHGALIKTLQT